MQYSFSDVIYMDNNATTCIASEVYDTMIPFFKDHYGNPSSIHRFGGMVKRDVEDARAKVANLIGAKPSEIYFTSCGSESDNMAIQGHVHKFGNNSRLITSNVEHPAILNTSIAMRKRGASVAEVAVDSNGLLDMKMLRSMPIDKHTLASFMWANNETGVIFPIEEITSFIKDHGGIMHTDAVQAVGKIAIDVSNINVDMLSLSGHKLHAPKGIGAIYIREGLKLPSLLMGGHQEHSIRAGTENVPYIIGLGKACELAMDNIDDENVRVRAMRDRLEKGLLEVCLGAKLNGDKDNRLPNTTNISFEFIEGEGILLLLDEKNIAASSGSACTTGSLEPSHVMRAMGLPYTLAHSSIRFSLSVYNTENEIDMVIKSMPPIIDQLRKLSPYVKD